MSNADVYYADAECRWLGGRGTRKVNTVAVRTAGSGARAVFGVGKVEPGLGMGGWPNK